MEAATALLLEGEALYAALERETLSCLEKLETMPGAEITRFVARREELFGALVTFHERVARLPVPGPAAMRLVADFRERAGERLCRVMEADRLLIALAGNRMTLLRGHLAAISRGHRALHGYGCTGRRPSPCLERNV